MHAWSDPIRDYFGIERVDDDTVMLRIRDEHLNPEGRLLGPVGFALVDYAMSSTLLRLRPGHGVATLDVALNFVSALTCGVATCRASVDRIGRTSASLRGEVRGADRTAITAIARFAIFPQQPGPVR